MDHFNECLPDSDKAGTYTHHSLMPSSPSMSCKLQRFFNVSISILLSIQLLMMQKEIILATSGMRIHPSNSFTSRMPYLLSLCYYSAYIPAGGLVFYNLALVYSLLCVLFILVVEPYRYEYKCHNYLEPCIILSISAERESVAAMEMIHGTDLISILQISVSFRQTQPFVPCGGDMDAKAFVK